MASRLFITVITACLLPAGILAQQPTNGPLRRLGVVGTAHLDTQWRWTIKNTIEEFIPNTLHDNFRLFEHYPEYVFSFEGAFRYMLAKEYYPEDYERLKEYIKDGRWRVTGSWVDACDVNIPSFESLVRHALYGNGFYKREFGKQSYDIFMPDCFGFGYALPSIAHHCGLKSFSTQKLTWGCSVPVPFSIGEWQGVDGSTVLAGLKTGNYVATFRGDLSRDTVWGPVIDSLGDVSGCYAGYIYFGTGDVGGAPDSLSVDWLTKSMHSDGPIKVASIGADDLSELVGEYPDAKLPRYNGELIMTRHGVGCYTSQGAMKRWNRKNEQLADASERSAVAASLLGGYTYPRDALRQAWVRFLWHQFHDDLTGTSIPEAYEFSWSDELLSLNQFSSILTSAVAGITPALDTRGKGKSYVVYNPLSIKRQDVVEVPFPFTRDEVRQISVYGPEGKEVPSQMVIAADGSASVLFLATVPSIGYAVYDIRPGSEFPQDKGVMATASTLENYRYKVTLNDDGDVSSILDKVAGREMLAEPIVWQLIFDKPNRWPAWEIQYEDLLAGPKGKVESMPEIEILESGAVRGALRVTRRQGNSTYRTTIRLAAGEAGNRIDFVNEVDWGEKETLLKVAFRPSFTNEKVTYDLGLGTITRGISTEKKYEVPGHQWADMADLEGSYGFTVMNDCKYGWDHPDSGTLRLTLIHTPGVYESWNWVGDQSSQDIGRHHFTYSVSGHQKGWQESDVPWLAGGLNQPLLAFEVPQHSGKLGKSLSLLSVNGEGKVMVNAVKLAENTDELIVRVKELAGKPADNMSLSFSQPVVSAREVNGQEESVGDGVIKDGAVSFSLTPYQPKAFAVQLSQMKTLPVLPLVSQPVALTYDLDGISHDANRADGDLDGVGNTLAGELLPDTLTYGNVDFVFGPKEDGADNVVSCSGQQIRIPKGREGSSWSTLHLILLATAGPAEGVVRVDRADGQEQHPLSLCEYTEPVGQWYNRMVSGQMVTQPDEITPAYINHAPVAWAGTHRHTADGKNDTYRFTYLYEQSIDLSPGAPAFVLPNNPRIKLLAASVSGAEHDRIYETAPLYDEASTTIARISATEPVFIDSTVVELSSPTPGAEVRYTLDGSEPTLDAPLFVAPFPLTSSTIIKARAYDRHQAGGVATTLAVRQLAPRASLTVGNVTPGLQCSYYEGEWQKLPNFDSLSPAKVLTVDSIVIPGVARPEDYGLVFKGFIAVPEDGLYEFGLNSDDGSVLYVADTLVVDNDGLHGSGEVVGKVALKKGFHPLEVKMFQSKGDQALNLFVTGPGIKKREIGVNMLRH